MGPVRIALGLFAGLVALAPTDANAVVCARGMYRAGCAGPHWAVRVRRGPYGHARAVRVRRY